LARAEDVVMTATLVRDARDLTELRDQVDPLPPYEQPGSVAAEQALLGAMLIDNREFGLIAQNVRPEDFIWAVHARIFRAISKLIDAGRQANPVTLAHLFKMTPESVPWRDLPRPTRYVGNHLD
jgi:hypothetical protein